MRRFTLSLSFSSFALLVAAAVAAGAGCEGAIGDGENNPPPPPDVEPKAVPTAPEVLESTSTCVDRAPGEVFLSVSPEGQAWLVTPGSPSAVRVLDAFGDEIAETSDEIEIDGIVDGQAWSGADASLIGDETLFRLENFARIELVAPAGFATPATLCGDPSNDGALVSSGFVFEQREDAWWRWVPEGGDDSAPTSAIRYDGACRSAEDVMWLVGADGTIFRVEAAQYTRPVRFEGLVAAAATEGLVAVLDDLELWVSPTAELAWQPWTFSTALPKTLAASGGFFWMGSGEKLLRFDGASWNEVTHTMAEPIEQISAHAGGVWLIGSDRICHQSLGTSLRVDGLRPFSRSRELEYTVRVRASDDSSEVTADVDGEPVELAPDVEDGWHTGLARLETIGWHEVSFGAGDARRTLHVKRLPEVTRSWEDDIAPIYAANCTSSTCHRSGSSDPPDLGSYEAWTTRASEVRTRVVEAKTMPPAANVGPEWGSDDIEVIQEWLEGGMLP